MGTEPNFDLIPFILPARMVVLSFGQCRNLHHKIKGSLKILKFKSFIKLFIFLLPHTLILSDGDVVRVAGFEPAISRPPAVRFSQTKLHPAAGTEMIITKSPPKADFLWRSMGALKFTLHDAKWVSAPAIHGLLAYKTPDEYVFRKFLCQSLTDLIFIIALALALERGR